MEYKGQLAVKDARIAALEAGIRQACKLLEEAPSSEPPS
jgi:hypothetical protein